MSMTLVFRPQGWEDYNYWQSHDRKMLKRINRLIDDSLRHPFEGIGQPEQLKYGVQGAWSRRIDGEHRLVYEVIDNDLVILQARYHYKK
jgi:toxin YoeB